MSIKIGDTVICVDSSMQLHTVEELTKNMSSWVTKDKQYVVRDIIDYDFVVAFLLEGVYNKPRFFSSVKRVAEPGFAHWRFRKLEEAELLQEVEVEENVLIH